MKQIDTQIVPGKRVDCPRFDRPISLPFCHKSCSWANCPSNCPYFSCERYAAPPNESPEITRVENGETILFAKDLFLPNIYEFFQIAVDPIKVIYESFCSCLISFKFTVTPIFDSQPQRLCDAYYGDSWKPHKSDGSLPFFQLYIPKGARLIKSELGFASFKPQPLYCEDNHRTTHLPFSTTTPRCLTEQERRKYLNGEPIDSALFVEGKHFKGNCVTFFANLSEKTEYLVNIEAYSETAVFNGGTLPILIDSFSLFFPFKRVRFQGVDVTGCFAKTTALSISHLKPVSSSLPRIFLEPLNSEDKDDIWVSKELIAENKPAVLDDYSAICLRLMNNVSDSVAIAGCAPNARELFLCFYAAVNDEDAPFFSPVRLQIGNCSNRPIKARYECFIEGLSSRYQEEIVVGPRDIQVLSPKLDILPDKALGNKSICERRVNVILAYDGKEILNQSFPVKVFPKMLFPREMLNGQMTKKYTLENYLARFVNPHSHAVATAISDTAHEMQLAMHRYGSLAKDGEVLKAIYDHLTSCVIYVNRTEASIGHTLPVQRISFPEETIRLRSGNCIDLSILLCSCYEALGFKTGIVLLPGHALVQIVLGEQTEYLEATFLGRYSFAEALQAGRDKVDNGSEKRFVDIDACRKRGIYPFDC